MDYNERAPLSPPRQALEQKQCFEPNAKPCAGETFNQQKFHWIFDFIKIYDLLAQHFKDFGDFSAPEIALETTLASISKQMQQHGVKTFYDFSV